MRAIVPILAAAAIACPMISAAEETKETLVPPAHLERAQQAYLAYCAMCHGPRGAGNGEVATALRRSNVKVPRLDDARRIAALGRAGVLRIVREGGAHVQRSNIMPEWGDLLGPGLAEGIADYVMTLPGEGGAETRRQIQAYLKAPPGVPERGREIYVYRCSACHGPAGKGDGPSGRMLARKHGIRPADLTDPKRIGRKSDRDLYELVALGGAHVGRSVYMPPNDDLTPGQIKSVIAYLRKISRTTSKPDPR